MRVADGEARIWRGSSFFHSSDVLAMLTHNVSMQRRPDADKKLERVAKIVAVVTIESVRSVVDRELCAESDVDAVAVR